MKNKSVITTFKPDATVNADKLYQAVRGDTARLRFTMTPSPHLTYIPEGADQRETAHSGNVTPGADDGAETVRKLRAILEGLK
jgi:hypothetical protein